jgi:hypothetical protein
MSRKSIEFDDSLFQHKIRKLAKKWKVDEKEFVREQGALFLNDIGRFVPPYKTFPFGKRKTMGTAADKKAGQLAILYDLKKIFFVPNADVYQWALKSYPRGQIYRGRKVIGGGVLQSLDEMKHFHNINRKRNGRPKSLRGFEQMWVSDALFKKYYKVEITNVGIAKAAIARCVKSLNAKTKIPVWIVKQFSKAKGSARMVKLGQSWSAVFYASAFGLQHVTGKTIRIIQKGRLKAMESRLKHIFRQSAKESGWKVR